MRKMNNPKIKYDPESKIISIKLSNKESVDSDVQGNIVVDYDKNHNIVNIDIMNVSFNEFYSKEFNLDKFLLRTKKITTKT